MKKNRLSTLFAVVAALVLTASCTTATPDNWVKVKGNKFIDPQGNELIFRGLCFSDPVKLVRDGQWNEHYFSAAADWRACSHCPSLI